MNLLGIIGICIVSVVISILFNQYKPEYSLFISLVCGCIVISLVLSQLNDVFNVLKTFLNYLQINDLYLEIIIKSLGICYITQIASDSCKDAGYISIGNKVDFAGKAAIIILSLPLFNELIDIALKLVSM